jgi:hypothetical protein
MGTGSVALGLAEPKVFALVVFYACREAPSRWFAADPTLAVMRGHSCGYAQVGLLLARAPKAVGRD